MVTSQPKLPRISIVTSCYNIAGYIEDTIKSVTMQGYPDLEYIVVDGGSTDGTLNLVDRYRAQISKIISEPDDGLYHAIQKGMNVSTGEIMAWLNADDIYLPWTLSVVGRIFAAFPDVDWIIGQSVFLNNRGECVAVFPVTASYPQDYIARGWYRDGVLGNMMQENMFWRRTLWDKVSGLNLNLRLAADYDLWVRFAQHSDLVAVATPLAAARDRDGANLSTQYRDEYLREMTAVSESLPPPPRLWCLMGRRSKVSRALLRLMTWRRTRVIGHSTLGCSWVMRRTFRTISRMDLHRLMLERAILKYRE